LGDDLVIFNHSVAFEYLKVCESIGLGINEKKSVVSVNKPVVEFAKRTAIGKVDVSAISFKQLLSNNNLFGRLEIFHHLWEKGISPYPIGLFYLAVRPKIWSKSFDIKLSLIALLTQFVRRGLLPLPFLLTYLIDPNKPLSYFGPSMAHIKEADAVRLCTAILKDDLATARKLMSLDFNRSYGYLLNINAFKMAVRDELFKLTNSFGPARFLDSSYRLALVVCPKLFSSLSFKQENELVALVGHFMNEPIQARPLELIGNYENLNLKGLMEKLELARSIDTALRLSEARVDRKIPIDNDLRILKFIRTSKTSRIQKQNYFMHPDSDW